jgi:hypothetical protein
VTETQFYLPTAFPTQEFAIEAANTCGNSYSTLWHVTAWSDSNTKIAGDYNYDLCSSSTNC